MCGIPQAQIDTRLLSRCGRYGNNSLELVMASKTHSSTIYAELCECNRNVVLNSYADTVDVKLQTSIAPGNHNILIVQCQCQDTLWR